MSGGPFARLARIATLLADAKTPRLPKLAVLAALLYAVVPVDLVPEAVLGPIGYLDDVVVAWAALRWLVKQDVPPAPPASAAPQPRLPDPD